MSHKWKTLNVVLFSLKAKSGRRGKNASNIFKLFLSSFGRRFFMRSNWNMRGVWLFVSISHPAPLLLFFNSNPTRKTMTTALNGMRKKLSRAFTFCRAFTNVFLAFPLCMTRAECYLLWLNADEKSQIKRVVLLSWLDGGFDGKS